MRDELVRAVLDDETRAKIKDVIFAGPFVDGAARRMAEEIEVLVGTECGQPRDEGHGLHGSVVAQALKQGLAELMEE